MKNLGSFIQNAMQKRIGKTRKVELKSIDGEPYAVEVPKAGNFDSVFMFALPKGGSTLLEHVMRDVCLAKKLPVIAIANDAFESGVPFAKIGQEVEKTLFHKGYIYLGFRAFFLFKPEFDFSQHKKILLVRDPRDMLVSLYFSMKKSHSIPKSGSVGVRLSKAREKLQEQDINDFVLAEAQGQVSRFNNYQNIADSNLKVYRYEDIIFDKVNWLTDMLDFLDISMSEDEIRRVAERHDIRPSKEDSSKHIRQVSPGNYKKHLSDECIVRLNAKLETVLKRYEYDA